MSFNDLLNKINQNRRLQEEFNPGQLPSAEEVKAQYDLDPDNPAYQSYTRTVKNMSDGISQGINAAQGVANNIPQHGHEIAKQAERFFKDNVKYPVVDAYDKVTGNDTPYNNAIKAVQRGYERGIERPVEDMWDKLSPMQQKIIKYGTPAALASGLGAIAMAKRMRNVNKKSN